MAAHVLSESVVAILITPSGDISQRFVIVAVLAFAVVVAANPASGNTLKPVSTDTNAGTLNHTHVLDVLVRQVGNRRPFVSLDATFTRVSSVRTIPVIRDRQ